MTFKTEEEVLESLAEAAAMVVQDVLTGEQAKGIAVLADIALRTIRQQNPMKYGGLYTWNQPCPLYSPLGSTIKL